MFWPVSRSHNFDVRESCLRSLIEFVVDAGVRNLNLVVRMWKFESFSDLLLDFGKVPFRLSFAGGVEGFLDFVFQFKIKLDAKILAPSVLDPPGFFEVGAVNLGIVLNFARLHQSVVKLLIEREFPSLVSQPLTVLGERYNFDALGAKPAPVITGRDGIDPD